ncbi:MAG: GNAT family N-acetyltransferase [Patescibacteria group bacterium]
MQFIEPTKEFENSWNAAIKEFELEGRDEFRNYPNRPKNLDEYIRMVASHALGEDLPAGFVPATTYWLVDGTEFIGHAYIRHTLNEHLLNFGGHIGYAIRPSARTKGYGTKILELALPKAKELGIDRVLVTCDESNIGSRKIIEKNGGVLENSIPGENGPKLRFWITL